MKYEMNIKDYDKIVIDSIDTIEVSVDNNSSTINIKNIINPYKINENFNELDSRLNAIESHLKLKYDGEIRNIKSKIDKLEGEFYGKR